MPQARKHTVVAIGSANPAKKKGAKLAFSRFFGDIQLKEVDTTSLVRAQPVSLEETVEGAEERAVFALESTRPDFGVGVEAGLVELGKGWPGHFLNLQIAAVVDREGNLSFGCSSGFPLPSGIVTRLKKNREELDRYVRELTGAKQVREEHGVVYHLTGKRLSRVEMTEQCVSMALVPWLNGKVYGFA
ncbi:MAG TPA: inosine/xanthosine triphosphatase [Nitrososphaerales archaeon]|nr:inosine/xanthosine triphosphatase [Nitrososphaerales archaeon]